MDKEKFKTRIAEAIKYSGYTQKQLAEMPYISEGHISNWKKGENLPSVEILGENADYLLGLD